MPRWQRNTRPSRLLTSRQSYVIQLGRADHSSDRTTTGRTNHARIARGVFCVVARCPSRSRIAEIKHDQVSGRGCFGQSRGQGMATEEQVERFLVIYPAFLILNFFPGAHAIHSRRARFSSSHLTSSQIIPKSVWNARFAWR